MMTITTEQKERLAKYEMWLHSAKYSDYIRNLGRREMDDLESLYLELVGERYPMNRSCAACVLRFVKILANYFYDGKIHEGARAEKPEDKTGKHGEEEGAVLGGLRKDKKQVKKRK